MARRTVPAPARSAVIAASVESGLARFRRFLKSRDLRLTESREAIVRVVLQREGHFDVEELLSELRRRRLGASRATVYRLVPLLTECGILQPAVVTGDRRNYETSFEREHHDHLVCSHCGRVVEFHFEAFAVLEREIAKRHDFELTSHHHELVGVCGPCRRRRPRRQA